MYKATCIPYELSVFLCVRLQHQSLCLSWVFRLGEDLLDGDPETNGVMIGVSRLKTSRIFSLFLRGDCALSFQALWFLPSCYMGYISQISCYGSAVSVFFFSQRILYEKCL